MTTTLVITGKGHYTLVFMVDRSEAEKVMKDVG